MYKLSLKNGFIFLLLIFCIFTLAGCSDSNSKKSPVDLIKEQYGDEEYKISFSSEGLDTPLNDLAYTAKNIPTLPTPQRVGYIFSGWFFDIEYQTQYQDNLLLMMMSDVTLYAKWTKEELITNGTYDIEFEAKILEETVKEGSTAELYGGYKRFPEHISIEDTYIEKSNNDLLLKIEYDCVDLEPYGALADSFNVSINAVKTPSSVYIKDKVSSLSDTLKTIYIRITDIDLSTPIYLDIETTNWWSVGLSDTERYNTTTAYTVEFNITRLIGFKTPYIDSSAPLEDGYYLVRSYYKKENNGESMASGFNSVYSYLKAENGAYTLIKPFTPYAGLVKYLYGSLQEPYASNLFYRMMSYMPVQYCFEVDTSQYFGEVSSDYYPAAYNAKYYLNYSVEFHTDNYRIYSIVDLGTDYKKELAFMYSVSGFMEVANGMGSGIEILYMDYDHIIKLSDTDVDYHELEGDSYEFETEEAFYPGSRSDINEKDLSYEEILENGLTTKMINFYYSALSSDSPFKSRMVYNSKISFSPTKETAAKTVADSRYSVSHFHVHTQIYQYDVKSSREEGADLYYDSMSVQTFGTTGMRDSNAFRIGKTLNLGEIVRLEDLYYEKVSSESDFSLVEYTAYQITDGKVDFSKEITVQEAFVFEKDIAVLFTYSQNGEIRTSLVELAEKSKATYRIMDDTRQWVESEEGLYVSSTIDKEGSSIDLPSVTYSWTGVSNIKFQGSWYDDESCINPLHIGIFANVNGVYELSYIGYQDKGFTISKYETYVYYEFVNIYGELDYILFTYVTSEKDTYQIEDDSGKVMNSGDVKYDAYGKMENVNAAESIYLTPENYEYSLSRVFYLSYTTNSRYAMNLSSMSATLVDTTGSKTTVELEFTSTDSVEPLLDMVKNFMIDYSYFTLRITYNYFENTFTSNYIYNINFSGSKEQRLLTYNSYFSNTKYTISIPIIYSMEGKRITGSYITVYHMKGGKRDLSYSANKTFTTVVDDYQFDITFNEAGSFYIGYSFAVNSISFSFGQVVNVLSNTSDVTITYITDDEHSFNDGLTSRTVTYNLANNILTLNKKEFDTSEILYGWTQYESRNASSNDVIMGGKGISNFIEMYNSQNVTLYAIWDSGITVTASATGNADIKKTYFRDSSNGCYIVDLSKFNVSVPAGYVLAGWTGGFLGSGIKKDKVYINQMEDTEDYFNIYAVFRRKLTVKYSISSDYSNSVIKNDSVVEGYTLDSNREAIAKIGYAFVGWYVLGDDSETIIDLSTYKFMDDTTLVAKFIEVAGD